MGVAERGREEGRVALPSLAARRSKKPAERPWLSFEAKGTGMRSLRYCVSTHKRTFGDQLASGFNDNPPHPVDRSAVGHGRRGTCRTQAPALPAASRAARQLAAFRHRGAAGRLSGAPGIAPAPKA